MRIWLATCAVALCTLPASGGNQMTESQTAALGPIDTAPVKSALDGAFGQQDAATQLQTVSLDRTMDLGIELRAIRAMPSYCPQCATAGCTPPPCGTGTIAHDTLVALINADATSQHTAQDLMRLRAAIEALGAIRSGVASDATLLLPLLSHSSRDVRATVARALLNVCNAQALAPLQRSYALEKVAQVKNEMSAAIQVLAHQCPNSN